MLKISFAKIQHISFENRVLFMFILLCVFFSLFVPAVLVVILVIFGYVLRIQNNIKYEFF